MSDPTDMRARLLLAALPEIAFTGFGPRAIAEASGALGIPPEEAAIYLPKGAASLVEIFSDWADLRMEEHVCAMAEAKMRQRIREAVVARLGALAAHKDAARKAALYFVSPLHAPLGARLLARTVDRMWRACGDRSTDFSFYTRRASLGAVYAATLAYWLSDSSEGHKDTLKFLDARLSEVMEFEKMKAKWREGAGRFPDPARALGRLREALRPRY